MLVCKGSWKCNLIYYWVEWDCYFFGLCGKLLLWWGFWLIDVLLLFGYIWGYLRFVEYRIILRLLLKFVRYLWGVLFWENILLCFGCGI